MNDNFVWEVRFKILGTKKKETVIVLIPTDTKTTETIFDIAADKLIDFTDGKDFAILKMKFLGDVIL